jgi:signal peptidase II
MRKENKKVNRFFLNFTYALFLALGFQLITYLMPTQFVYLNTRLIFGTLESATISIVLLSLAALISIYFLIITTKSRRLITFLLAGLISNLFDRIFRGGVIDYIYIHGFPMFNIPDIAIVVTITLLAISGLNKLKSAD